MFFKNASIKVKAIFIVIFISVIVAAYIGYQKHNDFKILNSMYPKVKSVSIRVNNDLKLELGGSNITYDELIKIIETDIDHTHNIGLEIESSSNTNINDKVITILNYISASQSVLRSQLNFVRNKLIRVKEIKSINSEVDFYNNSPILNNTNVSIITKKLQNRMDNVNNEYTTIIEKHIHAIINLKECASKMKILIPQDTLCDISLLNKTLNELPDIATTGDDN